ncbi:hypothetical protein HED49_19740 [Ochrobactrum daejeonense]|nr:hypothetical protein [Brucella daejeonensis]
MKANCERILSLLIAAAVAFVMSAAGVPLAWVIGPMTVSAAISLSGRQTFANLTARKGGQMIVGSAVGLNLTLASVQTLWIWIPAAIVINIAALFSRFSRSSPCRGVKYKPRDWVFRDGARRSQRDGQHSGSRRRTKRSRRYYSGSSRCYCRLHSAASDGASGPPRCIHK